MAPSKADLTVLGILGMTLFVTCSAQSTSRPVVSTQQGDVMGVVATWTNGRQYQAFRGIPFAEPPTGELRFMKPQVAQSRQQVLDASAYGKECPQNLQISSEYNETLYGEDCLFLNVFTPETRSASTSLPVLIYIHGGGFISGSANMFEPGALMTTEDIVIVTINYRIGILGFLSTGDSRLPGNYGLWDQHLAIQWVRDNIAQFGGDTSQITISGESAGSASVSYQTLAAANKGLFKAAILQSGTVTSSWALQWRPADVASNLLQNLECEDQLTVSSTKSAILSCLQQATVEQLADAARYTRSVGSWLTDFVYVPVVDGEFVPKVPAAMLEDSQYLQSIGFYDRDYMCGVTNNEGSLIYSASFNPSPFSASELDFTTPSVYNSVVETFVQQRFNTTSTVLENKIKAFYKPTQQGQTALAMQPVLDSQGDPAFYAPLARYARAIARGKQDGKKNLVYYFNHYPAPLTGANIQGTFHGMDLLYEFDIGAAFPLFSPQANASLWNEDDVWMGSAYREILLDFALGRTPGSSLQPPIAGSGSWPDYDLQRESYLSLSPRNATVGQHLLAPRVEFWLQTLPQELVSDVNGGGWSKVMQINVASMILLVLCSLLLY